MGPGSYHREVTTTRPPLADLLLALCGLGLTGIIVAVVVDDGPSWYGVADILIHLGLCVALAVRHVWRRASFVATYALLAALALVVWAAPINLGVSPLILCAPLALYVVSRHEPAPWGAAGLLLGIAGAFVSPVTRMPGGSGGLVPLMILGMVGTYLWASGRRRAEVAYAEQIARERVEHERELSRRVAQAQSDERARIARELHDIVAHSLAVVTVQANTALALGTPEHMRESLVGVRDASKGALGELRSLVTVLRTGEPDREVSGDLLRLPALAREAQAAGVRLDVDLPDGPTLRAWQETWPASVRLAVVRVVQEALSNVIKHGGDAPQARLHVDANDGACLAVVTNDAVRQGDSTGHGLLGLRERVGLAGGEFTAGPCGDGFEVRVRIPTEVAP